jgi:hypothetical protein
MQIVLQEDEVVFIHNKFIGQKFEHTNLAKLNPKRIISIDWSGAKYQLKKKDVITFERSNNWDCSYYKTPCGVEFKLDCGYNYFKKDRL